MKLLTRNLIVAIGLLIAFNSHGSLIQIGFEDAANNENVTNKYISLGVEITNPEPSGFIRAFNFPSLAVGNIMLLPSPDTQGASYIFTFFLDGEVATTDYFSILSDNQAPQGEQTWFVVRDEMLNVIFSTLPSPQTLLKEHTFSGPGIHQVEVFTIGNPGIGLDELKFNAVTAVTAVPSPTTSMMVFAALLFAAFRSKQQGS
jgi:hypothetical protein